MIKVLIEDADYGMRLNIAIVQERDGKRFVAKPVELIFEEDTKGYIDEPTLKISGYLKDAFLKAMAEALDKKGVKTDNDFKIQGLLEAKGEHLEDMRRLVFQKKYSFPKASNI